MSVSDYEGYEAWKGWGSDSFLATTPHEASYFPRDFAGIPLEGRNLLEIGFGNGGFLAWAQSKGANIHGTEIIPTKLDLARRHGIALLSSDLKDNIPEYESYFDIVVALDVLEHLSIAEIEDVLDHLARLLKPGGMFVARFPNGQSPFGRYLQHADYTHRSALSVPILSRLIMNRPFRVVRATSGARVLSGSLPRRLGKFLRYRLQDVVEGLIRTAYSLGNHPLGLNIVIYLERTGDVPVH